MRACFDTTLLLCVEFVLPADWNSRQDIFPIRIGQRNTDIDGGLALAFRVSKANNVLGLTAHASRPKCRPYFSDWIIATDLSIKNIIKWKLTLLEDLFRTSLDATLAIGHNLPRGTLWIIDQLNQTNSRRRRRCLGVSVIIDWQYGALTNYYHRGQYRQYFHHLFLGKIDITSIDLF